MKYTFNGFTLTIPHRAPENVFKMGAEAPYSQFVQKKLRDTGKELGCVSVLIPYIPAGITRVMDLMAGVGFVHCLLQAGIPQAEHVLNDLSPECADILKFNNPHTTVYCLDGLQLLRETEYSDSSLVWIDFNNLSWRTIGAYVEWFHLAREKSKCLIFTDSSVYGLTKFGTTNLDSYGVASISDYFERLLDGWLQNVGWRIRAVSYFGNASFILCLPSEDELPADITIIPYPPAIPVYQFGV